jgi:hypothetical protein
MRLPSIFALNHKRRCVGGPMNDHTLMLSTPSTLIFTLNGMTGHYHSDRLAGDVIWRSYVYDKKAGRG